MQSPAEYLKRPYARVTTPEPDGSWRAEILEFPGCIALGENRNQALDNLEDVAESWLEAVIEKGQHVPEPMDESGFSGKLVVRLPKSLHRKAAQQAARESVSLNQFIVACIAEQVGVKAAQSSNLASHVSQRVFAVRGWHTSLDVPVILETSHHRHGGSYQRFVVEAGTSRPTPLGYLHDWQNEDTNA